MTFPISLVFSFAFIFFFSSIDNSIAPMAKDIASHFSVKPETGLLLISACSWSVAAGLLAGPSIISAISPSKTLFFSGIILSLSSAVFPISNFFPAALVLRVLAGFGGGLAACVMWWMAYHGVEKKHSGSMLAVLMSARPLAVALGVPASALAAFYFHWSYPIFLLSAGVFISAAGVYFSFPEGDGILPEKRIWKGYSKALSTPYASAFYLGFFLNRMCYFGFYAFCGIWFSHHYGFDLKTTGYYLLIIGLAEAAVNFFSASLVEKFGYMKIFYWGILSSAFSLPLFLFGKADAKTALVLISFFMLADRIYVMALASRIPKMFSSNPDKTSFGSLNTLSAWAAGGLIAAVFSGLIEKKGIFYAETLILFCFLSGSYLLFYCLKKTQSE